MSRLRSGNLRHRFEVQSYTETQDSLGGVSRTWSTDSTRWGSVEQLTAQERVAHNQQEASEAVRIVLRYYEGLTTDQRLLEGGPDGYIKFSAPNAANSISAAASTSQAFYRPANGAGSTDAWTVATRFKAPSTSTAPSQTILHYGQMGVGTGWVSISYNGSTEKLQLYYGSDTEYLSFTVSMSKGTWQHLIITYDGGTTGVAPLDIADYYSRFTFWVNGVATSPTTANSGSGWDGSIPVSAYRIGSSTSTGQEVDENFAISQLAVWDSDQTSNVDTIYAGGNPKDLTSLSPQSQWLFEDVVDTGTITDTEGFADMTALGFGGNNFTPSTGRYNIRSVNNVMERDHKTVVIASREV